MAPPQTGVADDDGDGGDSGDEGDEGRDEGEGP